MIEDYKKARRLGLKEFHRARSQGRYPYLPVLDEMLSGGSPLSEFPVGLVDIPLAMLAGTKTVGRREAFAADFMPLLEETTEFALKWSNLYESQVNEGIRDAIKVYEYMHRFYVMEGNKRVSVSKYVGAHGVMGDVTRLLPNEKETDETDYKLYMEFLDFYKVCPLYEIDFSEVGSYKKLALLMKQDFIHPWPQEMKERLRGGFQFFQKVYDKKAADKIAINASDAFLIYLNIYHLDEMRSLSTAALSRRINKLWNEMLIQSTADNRAIVRSPEEMQEMNPQTVQGLWGGFFGNAPASTYTKENPLRVAFCYERPADTSSWIYGHELGRNYIENVFDGRVETIVYDQCDSDEALRKAVDTAAIDENELIFTVSPAQMQETLRCAIHFPKLHFLNCSVNLSHTKVRTYYGRMYEAKAILGALAASLCENHKIGYVADYPIFGSVAEINAFAIGAAMIDPNIKIYLEWTSIAGSDWRLSMKENGVSIISGQDFIKPNTASREYGLFKVMDDGSVQNLAAPMWNWGKFYELIIQSYLDGRWDETPTSQAVNYWWGMSAGVIELILSDKLSYYSKKLVMNLQNAMVQDALGPFAGEIHTQDGDVLAMDMTKLGSEEILTMDWLNDNVIGRIPKLEELTESAKNVVLVSGIKNDDL